MRTRVLSRLTLLFLLTGATLLPALGRDLEVLTSRTTLRSEQTDDRPPESQRLLNERGDSGNGPDTLRFGYVDEDGFAILEETWTFDHGGNDPFEGWTFDDLTEDNRSFIRHITSDVWANGDADNGNVPTENTVAAPVLSGLGSAWVGAFQNEADDLCWDAGLGYGNSWGQRLISPIFDYDGDSTIEISFLYFNDTEEDFDYTRVIVQTLPSGEESRLVSLSDEHGLAPDHPTSPPVGTSYVSEFSNFQTDSQFRLIFEMTSDVSWSDEDGQYTTEYGPFGVDDVVLQNTGPNGDVTITYDFETGLDGWTREIVPGYGVFEGVADAATYDIEDPCQCELRGNVLGFHDDNFEHHVGQWLFARTPAVNVVDDVLGAISGNGQLEILAEWSQYSAQPSRRDVFYRPGWEYYPAICEVTGERRWSDRVGSQEFFEAGPDPRCFQARDVGTGHGLPVDVEQVRFVYELYVSCDAGGPNGCGTIDGFDTSFPPLIDNVEVRFTLTPNAPSVVYAPGTQYTDGFSQGLLLDSSTPGNADVVRTIGDGNTPPLILGDSLFVSGHFPGPGTEYDTRLWFRVARKGPGSNPDYDSWRARVQEDGGIDAVDGVTDIEAGDFATAKMDSFNVGVNSSPFQYHSYFIEADARYGAGAGQTATENEIIADGILVPGTEIEYFVTSNYVTTPDEFFLLPDTTGGFYSEFEILPRWRDDGGVLKFPCLLYIDAYNQGAQTSIEAALTNLGLDFDRYDYLDSNSSWKAPLARGATPANNGCSVFQLAGYRTILVNTGTFSGSGVLWPEDLTLLSDWLTMVACDSNQQIQGLIMNGDGIGSILAASGPAFSSGQLGITHVSDSYNAFGATPDENYCVALESPSVGSFPFGTVNSQTDYLYEAWGNWCPQVFSFDVLGATGSGVGNRAFIDVQSAEETSFSQVANDRSANSANYRSIVDGVSWHHLSERDVSGECVPDSAHIVSALGNELAAALEWVFGVGSIPSLCEGYTCESTAAPIRDEAMDGSVTRLFQNSPNPFNPYTTLRFSLATSARATLRIYDVTGRGVRTLIDGKHDAGAHEVVWDGADDVGQTLPAGVYWSQLDALGYRSNMKMVLLERSR